MINRVKSSHNNMAAWISMGLGLFYWIADSFIHTFLLHREDLLTQLFTPPPHDLFTRILITLSITGIVYAGMIIAEQKKWSGNSGNLNSGTGLCSKIQ